jgi:GNAT superfamily N-acetyltransferase
MKHLIDSARGQVTIRLAAEEDAPAFRDLRLEALRNHPEVFSSDYAANLSEPMSYWVKRLSTTQGDRMVMTVVAEHERILVGMGTIMRTNSPKVRHSATIVGMYVQPEWRGLKIADKLIEACIEWARTTDIKIVKLAVVSTNVRAICCYSRCGFRVYGIEPQALSHDQISYDELLMARTL